MQLLIGSLAMLVTLAASSVLASDYYVDATNGSDTQGNGSLENPWRTITFALSQVPGPDDTVRVGPGTYDSAHGEVFPLRPAPKVSLRSREGADVTRIAGISSVDVLHFPGADQFNAARPVLDGFEVSGGRDGVVVLADVAGETAILSLLGNTITGCIRAGCYTAVGLGGNGLIASRNRIHGNGIGLLANKADGTSVWALSGNVISANVSHGIQIRDGILSVVSEGDVIRDNGGVGIWQSTTSVVQTTLRNTTVSSNVGGGLYVHADNSGYPNFFDPVCSIGAQHCVVYGNGGFGGTLTAGSSASRFGQFNSSIAWGNATSDNSSFRALDSNIGSGRRDSGSISVFPAFVEPGSGDFRLRFDSPCVDAGPFSGFPIDFEGEARPSDGDSDGISPVDMGIDEFHTFVAPGTQAIAGQPFWFLTQAPPIEDGHLVTVLMSFSRAGENGGVRIPGSQGRTIDLAPDSLFQFSLRNLPFLQATLASQQGTTSQCTIPPGVSLPGPVYYAGVSIDLAQGKIVSITPTHSFEVQ